MNQNQNPQIENNDLTFCPSFNCYSSNTSSSSTAAAAFKISSSLPKDDLYNDNDFNFVIEDNNNSSPTTTIYPLFNQSEKNCCDTLQNLFITEREDDTSSSDEEEENENEPVFCVWKSTKSDTSSSSSSVALTKCKKSSSTGSGSGSGPGSKRWRIRDLLRRSNSEGKDQQPISNMLLTQHNNNNKVVTKQKRNSVEGGVNNGRSKQPSVHEIFYVQNRAKTEDGKRRSYLPYRQGLVGFFSNVNGKGKSFPF
ncbi:hypothetical protein CTI12_AA318120 [Artemisia annua]|uniref:Uncharacterized protein n=1 Tax=Artemisia annua TaxID=35608 RepID=A0A2U1MUV0_ARTAN|nr:hypothetical protein CTI12_AA318120 [Artemisia annua]